MLRLTNSQSRQKEEFKPLDPAGTQVKMYVCGPTVYDSLHLGHARAAVTPDIVRRHLEYKGYQVRYVMNFTDVDDKIIRRANEEKRDWKELTEYYINEFHVMMKLLNVKPADVFPRATENIPEMIEIVQRLLERKHAYVAADGDVYFDTTSYARYGNLSGRKIDDDESAQSRRPHGANRVSDERLSVKKHPGDFVLWKLAKPNEPFWESPWGKGRPGWHLECSAMSKKFLGVPFDIHGGGPDLLFPHHEDEKAQTECAFCEELHSGEAVRYWVHHGFLTINNEKMGKSLGNAKWLREMIWPEGPHDPMALRMIFLSSHYRAPINFEPGLFDEAKARLDRIYNALESIQRLKPDSVANPKAVPTPASKLETGIANARMRFDAAMDDDFNTAEALAGIFELIGEVNREIGSATPTESLVQAGLVIQDLLGVLGLRPNRATKGDSSASPGTDLRLVELLLEVRQDVRAAKLYALSDKIRNGLKTLGYEVEDLPGGKWVVKKKE